MFRFSKLTTLEICPLDLHFINSKAVSLSEAFIHNAVVTLFCFRICLDFNLNSIQRRRHRRAVVFVDIDGFDLLYMHPLSLFQLKPLVSAIGHIGEF